MIGHTDPQNPTEDQHAFSTEGADRCHSQQQTASLSRWSGKKGEILGGHLNAAIEDVGIAGTAAAVADTVRFPRPCPRSGMDPPVPFRSKDGDWLPASPRSIGNPSFGFVMPSESTARWLWLRTAPKPRVPMSTGSSQRLPTRTRQAFRLGWVGTSA